MKKKLKKGNFKQIIVHDGSFHTDDVMCAAIAKYINPDVSIVRLPSESIDFNEYERYGTVIADVGFGKYDHHQANARIRRETGYPYVACSLLLHDCWHLIFHSRSDYYAFERTYILPIELGDNGVTQNPLSAYISSYRPSWDSDKDMNQAFLEAVDVCLDLIKKFVSVSESKRRAIPLVKKALKNSDGFVVVLEKKMPYKSALRQSSAKFVIYPGNGCKNDFSLRCVEKSNSEFDVIQRLPESWLTSKPVGCSFVHQQRFLAGFDTLEHALAAAESLKGMDDDNSSEKEIIAEDTGDQDDVQACYSGICLKNEELSELDMMIRGKLKSRIML